MSSETLTSLAMLKVQIDRGGDYLDYLVPFVLQILADRKPDPVTADVICSFIKEDFGLIIPQPAVQIVLRRIARKHLIELKDHLYHIQGEIPNPGIAIERAAAIRHINAVVSGLMEFSKQTGIVLETEDEATNAICGFLSEFNIPCLRAYLRGTALPDLKDKRNSDIVLVGQYVIDLQQKNPERFESFLVMLQGHMLANALLCPNLDQIPKTYKSATFYLDTPLLVRILGVEGEQRKDAVSNLVRLLKQLGAKVDAFSHSMDELIHVLRGAAEHINTPDGRGAIILEARRSGISKSDLLLLAERAEEDIVRDNIDIIETPAYDERFRRFEIGEEAFEKALDDEVTYYNPKARQNDIRSVRCIYVLRGHSRPSSLEKSCATLVTSNSGFARAAFEYGNKIEQSRDVSSVITDFSLANMAWLKAPMGSPSLPRAEVLAFSYAALRPSRELLDKYLNEIDKLERKGRISVRDHQLLRSSTSAQEELMKLTLGDDSALTEETVIETLERISAAIRLEETDKVIAEAQAHKDTKEKLEAEIADKCKIQENLYWRCDNAARQITRFCGILLFILLFTGIVRELFGFIDQHAIIWWPLMLASIFMLGFSLLHYANGTTIRSTQDRLHRIILTFLLDRESKLIGFDIRKATD
jgi:hypothetical protein